MPMYLVTYTCPKAPRQKKPDVYSYAVAIEGGGEFPLRAAIYKAQQAAKRPRHSPGGVWEAAEFLIDVVPVPGMTMDDAGELLASERAKVG